MAWTPNWMTTRIPGRTPGRMPGLLTRRLFARRCPLCCVPETDGGLCGDCMAALPVLGPHCRICCEPLAVPPAPAQRTAVPPHSEAPTVQLSPPAQRTATPSHSETPVAPPPLPAQRLATPLHSESLAVALPVALCARCLAAPPRYERVLAPCLYAPLADRMIRQFKYGGRIEWAAPIGKLLARHVRAAGGELPGALVPVPLHRARLRQRGFNQSLEIARVLAAELGVRLEAACVSKTRHTTPQTALDAKRRRRNLNGAFHLRRRPRAQRVAIVDDVMTTGATVGEMARVLAHAGVAHIEVWVAARTAM